MSLDGTGYSPPPAFGRFRVLHQVGAGLLGPVFRGHDPEEGRLVAIKVFRLDVPREKAVELASELEHIVELDLAHPGLVAVQSAGLEGAVAYLVEDFFAADSLDAALRQYGPAPALQALNVLARLAGALDFSAAVGAFHGALHSRDILVSPDDSRITGIGVAGALERCGIPAPARGPYSAPERLKGAPPGSQSDVYSLAVCAHELLTARLPVLEGDKLRVRVEGLGWDQERVASVFERGCALDPGDRYSSALELVTALQEALREPPSPATAGQAGIESARAASVPDASEPAKPEEILVAPVSLEAEAPPVDDLELYLRVESDHRLEPSPRANGGEPGAPPAGLADAAGSRLPFESEDLFPSEPPASSDTERVSIAAAHAVAAHPPEDGSGPSSTEPAHLAAAEWVERGASDVRRPGIAPEARPAARSKSASLPLLLTLLLGLLVGFVTGYVVGISRVLPAPTPGARPAQQQAVEPAEGRRSGAPGGADVPGTPAHATKTPAGADGAVPAAAKVPAPAETALAPLPSPDRPAPGVVLEVRSTPLGARVALNGEARGRTPASIGNLPAGRHTLELSLPGYTTVRRQLNLRAGQQPERVSLALTRAPQQPQPAPRQQEFIGSMLVESRPTGARVVLDGRTVGTTPLSLPSVAAGSHVVRLELEGHLPWTASIRVAAGQRATVRGSLEPERYR